MTVDALSAANAYRNQIKMMQGASDAPTQDETSQPSFSQMVESAARDTVNTMSNSEGLQMQSMTGKVELSDLVTAVANAELSLNTVVAIRDRVINAYNDIIKMAI